MIFKSRSNIIYQNWLIILSFLTILGRKQMCVYDLQSRGLWWRLRVYGIDIREDLGIKVLKLRGLIIGFHLIWAFLVVVKYLVTLFYHASIHCGRMSLQPILTLLKSSFKFRSQKRIVRVKRTTHKCLRIVYSIFTQCGHRLLFPLGCQQLLIRGIIIYDGLELPATLWLNGLSEVEKVL